MWTTVLQTIPSPQPSPSSPSQYPPSGGVEPAGSEPGGGNSVLWILALIALLYLSNYVYKDAKNKGVGSPIFWGLLVFLVPIIGLPLYALVASDNSAQDVVGTIQCPDCGKRSERDSEFCSDCGSKIRASRCDECGCKVSGENYCPECGTELDTPQNESSTTSKSKLGIVDLVSSAIVVLGTFFTISGISLSNWLLLLIGTPTLAFGLYLLSIKRGRRWAQQYLSEFKSKL